MLLDRVSKVLPPLDRLIGQDDGLSMHAAQVGCPAGVQVSDTSSPDARLVALVLLPVPGKSPLLSLGLSVGLSLGRVFRLDLLSSAKL